MNFSKLTEKQLNSYEAYALTLTIKEVNQAHENALRSLFDASLTNNERNMILKLQTEETAKKSVLKRSNLDTKSACIDNALTEFASLERHTMNINKAKHQVMNKKTRELETVVVTASYVKRHCNHLDSAFKHLVHKVVNIEKVNEFKYEFSKERQEFLTIAE